jgi:hypothetical protein
MGLDLDVLIQKVICSQIYHNLSCYIFGGLSKRHHSEMTPTVIYTDVVNLPMAHWTLELDIGNWN